MFFLSCLPGLKCCSRCLLGDLLEMQFNFEDMFTFYARFVEQGSKSNLE